MCAQIIERLNAINRDLADVWWYTSWRGDAALKLAPALGLDRFPSLWLGNRTCFATLAKRVVARILHPQRACVWIDDEMFSNDPLLPRPEWWERRPGPSLAMGVHGLLHEDLAHVEHFLRAPAQYAGPRCMGLPVDVSLRMWEAIRAKDGYGVVLGVALDAREAWLSKMAPSFRGWRIIEDVDVTPIETHYREVLSGAPDFAKCKYGLNA